MSVGLGESQSKMEATINENLRQVKRSFALELNAGDEEFESTELFALLAENLRGQEISHEDAENWIEAFIEILLQENEEVKKVCLGLGGLESLISSWQAQTDLAIGALETIVDCYVGDDWDELDNPLLEVEEALAERDLYNSQYNAAQESYIENVYKSQKREAIELVHP